MSSDKRPTRHGRPLTPDHEQIAREHAAWAIEQSTQAQAVLAKQFREYARRNVAIRQYQWAGLYRRVAEMLEGDLLRPNSSVE